MVFGLVVLVLILGCVLLQWLNFGDFIRDLLWLRTRIFVYCMLRLIVCVTQILQRRNGVTNASLPLINGILKLLSGSCQVSVNHLYCEVNCAADFLANYSLTLSLGLYFFLNSPS